MKYLVTAGLLLGLAGGCTVYSGSASDFSPQRLRAERGWLVAGPVPFEKQATEADCGAAALSMVLRYWGVPATRAEIWRTGSPPIGRGLKAGQLRDIAKSKGMSAFLFQGDLRDVERELSRGRPVLVGLLKPHRLRAFGHYEVVVAYNPRSREIVTLDPARGWRKNTVQGFLKEWEPSRRATLVVFPRPVATR